MPSKTDPLESAPDDFRPNATTLYDLLDVSESASKEEIETAYRNQIKKHHPDRSDRDDAEDITFTLNNAIKIIGDNNERLLYEQLGHDAYFNQASGAESPYEKGNDKTKSEPNIYELIQMTNLQSHINTNQSLLYTIVTSSGFKILVICLLLLTLVYVILSFM